MTSEKKSLITEAVADATLGEVREVATMLRDYAKQETLGPLRGWRRYVVNGVVASLLLGIGLVISVVGVLRLLQTETSAFEGPTSSLLVYVIALGASAAIIALVGWKVRRSTTLVRRESTR